MFCLKYFTGDTACFAPDGQNLQCKFPENINITRKDFVVYFYPTGGDGDGNLKIISVFFLFPLDIFQ